MLEVETNTTIGTLKAMVQQRLAVDEGLAEWYVEVGDDGSRSYRLLSDDASSLAVEGFEDGSVVYLLTRCPLLGVGIAITDIFAFLAPADQHKLRLTSSRMCEWFDSAAENGSLPFFLSIDADPSGDTPTKCRWKHITCGLGQRPQCSMLRHITVTVHTRNYCLSTLDQSSCSVEVPITDGSFIDNANQAGDCLSVRA